MKKLLFALLLCSLPVMGQVSNPTTGFSALATASIPVIVAPNGTIATSGVVTPGTALPNIFPYAWLYFPAGAVSGGSAGLYYATCTATTTCQVYTNFVDASATAFTPFIPTSPVAAVGSNSAYTQTTAADLTLLNVTVPAGTLGAKGVLRKSMQLLLSNNANAHTFKTMLGGSTAQVSGSIVSVLNYRTQVEFHNMGDASHQSVFPSYASIGGTGTALAIGTTNTANQQSLTLTCQLAVATDYCGVLQSQDEFLYQP
jgi:hypothetical protein